MKIKTIKKVIFICLINHVFSGTKFFEIKRKLMNSIGHKIGEGTKIVGPVYCTGKLEVAENCWIGRNFAVEGNGTVFIQKNCDIAPQVTFLTGGHKISSEKRRAGEGEKYCIEVGEGSWICARATIGKQIRIGKGCVIASCACVMKDVDDNVLVGGIPAGIIKRLDD